MSDDPDTCGHPTADGEPCKNPASEGNHCWIPSHGGSAEGHGRPSKLSKGVVDQITKRIAEGKSDAQSFRDAKLHPSTKGNWLQRAAENYDSVQDIPLEPDFEESPYAYFFRRYEHARSLGEDWYVENIMEMAVENSDTATLMAMLKQRYPESWGDVKRGEQAGGVVVNVGDPDDHEIDPDTLEVIDE